MGASSGRDRTAAEPARYAVLGYPAAHSLSPPMQAAAFAAERLPAVYEALDVAPGDLGPSLARLHADGYAGLNLTAPHKERALEFARSVSPEGARLGSVNTLSRAAGGWAAHATDGLGFQAWAREASLPIGGARVALLGTGGAARAVAPYLAALGAASVAVVGRSGDRAASVADAGRGGGGETEFGGASWSGPESGTALDVLVRALGVPEIVTGEERWWSAIRTGGTVVDLNYGRRAEPSRLLAGRLGLRFEDGRGLLLHQGALSFTAWTGRAAPLEAMRRALEAALR